MTEWRLAWRWWWLAVAMLVVGAWIGGWAMWWLMVAAALALGMAVAEGRPERDE